MSGPDAGGGTGGSDWRDLALEAGGRCLIEASAGTGKTWTIAVLYLRLLLERGLSPRQIVVTTFTVPAAQELRDRLRSRLLGAAQLARDFIDGHASVDAAGDDVGAAWLLRRWADPRTPAAADLDRLRMAESEFDLGPITTLHGLCRRILADFPFESGCRFDPGELVSSQGLLDGLADDMWRVLQQGPPDAADTVVASLGHDKLRRHLKAYLAPGVGFAVPDETQLAASLPATNAAALRALAARRELFGSRRTLRSALARLADYLESSPRRIELAGKFEQLAPDDIADHLSAAGRADPQVGEQLAFAARAADALQQICSAPAIRCWQRWIERLRGWREQRLDASSQLSYDDLLTRVHRALQDDSGSLAARLAETWPVALVDEFQDTDLIQYGILDRIYRDADGRPRGRLVMIGDPKQAIYRFRGGDIHAYLEAAAHAGDRLSLDVNFRSSRELVAAFNEFHACAGAVLSVDPDHPIRYQPVRPGTRCDTRPYTLDGRTCTQPLVMHVEHDAPADAPGRRSRALEACANQIAQMLGDAGQRIGADRLAPGDIAVLLPGHADVKSLRQLLLARGVPCVGAGRSHVFETDCARELQIVLYAIANPGDEPALRAALATQLIGTGFARLREYQHDDSAWQRAIVRFDELRRTWRGGGALALAQALAHRAAPRLLAAPEGERVLADLRHLGELLQARSVQVAGIEQLLAWLAAQRAGAGDDGSEAADELQLRLESDAKRVKLMTLHASKGLEFPLVFLPLMWRHGKVPHDTIPIVHRHSAHGSRRIAGFGAAAQAQYDAEGQDERFRVLYVAMTRARHACHVYVLPPDRPATAHRNAPLADPERSALDAMLARMRPALDDAALAAATPHIQWSVRGWHWSRPPRAEADAAKPPRHALAEPPDAEFEFKYSFSALTRSRSPAAFEDAAASDETALDVDADDATVSAETTADAAADASDEASHPQLQWLAPVRGIEIGNALHAVFEHRRIGQPMSAQHELVRHCLIEAGVRVREPALDELVPRLAARVQATLQAELLSATQPKLCLERIPASHLRAEMEFHYALGEVSMRRLHDVCAAHGEPGLVPRTSLNVLRGLMTGKIDLVFQYGTRFHVLDYKGNWLGDRLSDYAPTALAVAMEQHHYRFQALLYTVAVDRYLRQRMPAYRRSLHLGETIYLFVRAAGLAPGLGVWAQRFDDDLLGAVDRVLATPAAASA